MWGTIESIWSKLLRDPSGAEFAVYLGMTVDVVTMVLELRRNTRGHGSSGLPGVTWVIYSLMIIFSNQAVPIVGSPRWLFKLYNILLLAVFHALCVYAVPVLHLRWLERRRARKFTANVR